MRFPVKLFFSCIVFLLSLKSFSQSSIRGTIKDSLGNAVQYCPLALMNAADSAIIKGNVSNENGDFTFSSVAKGTYRIKVSAIGFADYFSGPVTVDSVSEVTSQNISLKSTASNLKEISVTAIKPAVEFKNGMIVLNVENNILATGNTALELLKRIPGVNVDVQNNVTVNGKSGVRFMIDGKLQQLPAAQMVTILSNMSSEAVSTIELIKNPPAKYDASGTGGLINIVVKKAKLKGFNGSIYASAGYGKRFGASPGVSLNFKSAKLSVFTNISYLNKDLLDVTSLERKLQATSLTGMNAKGENETFKKSLDLSAGLEYDLTSKTTIGLNIKAGASSAEVFRQSATTVQTGDVFDYKYRSYTLADDKYTSPSATVYFVHAFDTAGTSLSASADYTGFIFKENQLNENYFFNGDGLQQSPMLGYKSLTDFDFRIATQKLDFTKALTKIVTLETGLKSSFVENASRFELQRNVAGTNAYFTDSAFLNIYTYREQIFAGYVNLITTLKKITLQTGLRAEQTIIKGISKTDPYQLRRDYLNFFPNVSVDYKASEKNNIQFSYSYRIDRPSYEQLNPGIIFNDRFNYWSGSPELKPQYSHNFNLELSHNNFITNSFGFTHVDNSIYNFSYVPDSSQISIDTVFNFASRNMISYTLFIQKQFTQWYSLQFSGMAAYFNSIGKIRGFDGNAETFAFKGSINNEFMLPAGFKLQLSASGSSPARDGIQLYGARGSIDVALQKKFMKNKLSLSLGVYDVLYTDIGKMSSTLPGQSFWYVERNDTRRVRLNVSYRFGNMRISRKVNGDNEESKRIKNAN